MGWLSKLFNLDAIEDNKPVLSTAQLKNSSADARNRLKLVLMHDRTQLAPETIEKMRDELITVISKYVEIDKDALRLDLETESNTIALVANIPVLRARETWDDQEDSSDDTPPATTATIHTSTTSDAQASVMQTPSTDEATVVTPTPEPKPSITPPATKPSISTPGLASAHAPKVVAPGEPVKTPASLA